MPQLSRRSFLSSAAAAPALAATEKPGKAFRRRSHPLEGIARENLKITDVKATLIGYTYPPDDYLWLLSDAVAWRADSCVVQVFTDKGIVGIGEGSPYGGAEVMKKFTEDYIRPALIGKNPFDVERLACPWAGPTREMGRLAPVRWHGAPPWAAADIALWDIIGKAKNMPVYKLLATEAPARPHVPVYASGGCKWKWWKRPEDVVDEAVRARQDKYPAFKFRIGTEWKNSHITMPVWIKLVRKIREAVGPDFKLIHEGNMRFTLAEALELCPVLEELKFLWFEEPLDQWADNSVEDHLKVKQALPHVLISGGELMAHRFEFKQWVDRGAFDIVQPDANMIGVTETWHTALMGHMQHRRCCPHNWHNGLTIMANAHVAAAIPNLLLLEYNYCRNPLKEEIFKDPMVVKNGYLDLPDRPGFGMELIPDLEKKFPFEPGDWRRPIPDMPSA
jgi:L-alanine-DL-glutamate epimerase-like enolase superfamily enzyme